MCQGYLCIVGAVESAFEFLQKVDAVTELAGAYAAAEVFNAAGRIVDNQRLITRAEEAAAIAALSDRDETGHGGAFVAEFHGNNRTDARILNAALAFTVTGMHVIGSVGVGAFAGGHTA